MPVLVHESMHDGVDNSYEEEIIASLLDSLTYAEVLTIDPAAANTGTELAAYNNVQLFALMNSIGRRGAGFVGVETSFDGDVYLGAGLENFDADSIRAGIASDPWYAQLPRGGSQGGAVLAALLGRFPESANAGLVGSILARSNRCHRSGHRPGADTAQSARARGRPPAFGRDGPDRLGRARRPRAIARQCVRPAVSSRRTAPSSIFGRCIPPPHH